MATIPVVVISLLNAAAPVVVKALPTLLLRVVGPLTTEIPEAPVTTSPLTIVVIYVILFF